MSKEHVNKPILFRSYAPPHEVPINCKIWEAARATSATLGFFREISIITAPGVRETFIDGSYGYNNPTALVLQEAKIMFPSEHVACIVSLGAGKLQPISISKLSSQISEAMHSLARDCEHIAEEMSKRFQNASSTYFRFNVEHGMQEVELFHSNKLPEVATHTRQYMQEHEVAQRFNCVIKTLGQRQQGIPTSNIGNT